MKKEQTFPMTIQCSDGLRFDVDLTTKELGRAVGRAYVMAAIMPPPVHMGDVFRTVLVEMFGEAILP